MLVSKGADVNAKNRKGWTPLHEATYEGHAGVVQLLLDNQADIETTDSGGYEEVSQLLLDEMADIKVKDNVGLTPLGISAGRGHEKVVQHMNADNEENKNGRSTLLQCAAYDEHETIVQLLLDNVATVDAVGSDGRSALHLAAHEGAGMVVQLLLDNRPNIKAKDSGGWTPLHFAAIKGYDNILKLLLKHGANIAAETYRCTPLYMAVLGGNISTAQVLLDAGQM